MASIEPEFDEEQDQVFIFEVEKGEIELRRFDWAKYGEASSWLTSPVFGLGSDRSKESERVLNAGYAYMRGETMAKYPDLQTKEEIGTELYRVLPSDDPFLIEWEYFVKKLDKDAKAL